MMEELKPCPFCGSENVVAFQHVALQPSPCVTCRCCFASTTTIPKWNTRAAQPPTLATARREALEEAAEIAESHKPSSSFVSERYWRGVDEAAHSIAAAIRSLAAQEGEG